MVYVHNKLKIFMVREKLQQYEGKKNNNKNSCIKKFSIQYISGNIVRSSFFWSLNQFIVFRIIDGYFPNWIFPFQISDFMELNISVGQRLWKDYLEAFHWEVPKPKPN